MYRGCRRSRELPGFSGTIATSRCRRWSLMSPISRGFVAALEAFVAKHGLLLVQFGKGQHKADVMAEQRGKFGMVFVGKAQEKTPVFRTEKRRNLRTGQPYPWIVRSTAMVNHVTSTRWIASSARSSSSSAPISRSMRSCA
jgi:hypothetical protein